MDWNLEGSILQVRKNMKSPLLTEARVETTIFIPNFINTTNLLQGDHRPPTIHWLDQKKPAVENRILIVNQINSTVPFNSILFTSPWSAHVHLKSGQ